jgi:type IV pilus assembly protein PilC
MSNYNFVAVDPQGAETRGSLDVADLSEALKRIKEMGLFPTRVLEPVRAGRSRAGALPGLPLAARARWNLNLWRRRTVKSTALAIFTRQLATLVEAGMPLLRGLRTLEEQEANATLKQIIAEVALSIESGASLTDALSAHPKVFNRLYLNMVRAGEISGALDTTLRRLAEFMEKAQRIKSKVKGAMFYPVAVLFVAAGVLTLMMVFVVPRFRAVFDGLSNGQPLPTLTLFVFNLSEAVKSHFLLIAFGLATLVIPMLLAVRTTFGRRIFDLTKLRMPVLGPLFRKSALSRLTRTLGTLAGNGVPILQSLTIARETAANVIIGRLISDVHANVKQGDPIAPTLKASRVFPAMVAGMVDVGEQTGALPEMLLKIADDCDQEVDNAASALTSLIEPIMIVFLAVVVGTIVIAMFLPIINIDPNATFDPSHRVD